MSDTRQHGHELIDRLPPPQLTAVARLLETMVSPDEDVTPSGLHVYLLVSVVIPPAVLAASLAAFIFLVSSAFWTQLSAVSTSFLYWSGLSSRSARSRISRFMY